MNEYFTRKPALTVWARALNNTALTGTIQRHSPKRCTCWATQQVDGKWYPALQLDNLPDWDIPSSGPCFCGTIK